MTGFSAKVSARMGQSPSFRAPQHVGGGSRSPARISCKAEHGCTASSHIRGHFTPEMCSTLTQEHMETPREVGLGGYLAPTGANHSFQGSVIQGSDLKPLRWEYAQARAAPGIQPSSNQFGNFILVLCYVSPTRDRAIKGRRG